MALEKTYIINVASKQVEFFNSYHKIDDFNGNKGNINFCVCIYEDSSKRQIIGQQYYNIKPDISDSSQNFIKQGYDYLKTLDEYKDAVDC